MKKRYLLTIRIPIYGIDDCDARMKAKDKMSKMDYPIDFTNKNQVKLQETFDDREPRGIWLVK